MTRDEFDSVLDQAAAQIRSTTNAAEGWDDLLQSATSMRANEDAQIYQHLGDAFKGVFVSNEYSWVFSAQGHRRALSIGQATLGITVIHREPKLEKIHGVDVIYSLDGFKTLGFQHKKRSRDGTFDFTRQDREQRDAIAKLCGLCRFRSPSRRKGTVRDCASLYVIGDCFGSERHVVSACQMEAYQREFGRDSKINAPFLKPLDLNSADRMFLRCRLGRRSRESVGLDPTSEVEKSLLEGNDVVIEATLNGSGRHMRSR